MKKNSVIENLYYTGNPNSDIVFVMVHGGPGAGVVHLRNMEGIKEIERYYQFAYYDQCIVSFAQKKIAKNQLVDELSIVIDSVFARFPDKKIILFAASFGCLISLLAIKDKKVTKNLSGLIMCSPFVYKNKKEGLNKFNLMVKEFSGNSILKNFISNHLSLRNFDSIPLKIIYKFLGKKGYQPRHIAQVSDWMFEQELSTCLRNEKIPILIIQGDMDKFSVISDVEPYLNDENLDTTYERVPKCGHDVPKDNPIDFELSITQFIDEKI